MRSTKRCGWGKQQIIDTAHSNPVSHWVVYLFGPNFSVTKKIFTHTNPLTIFLFIALSPSPIPNESEPWRHRLLTRITWKRSLRLAVTSALSSLTRTVLLSCSDWRKFRFLSFSSIRLCWLLRILFLFLWKSLDYIVRLWKSLDLVCFWLVKCCLLWFVKMARCWNLWCSIEDRWT